MECAIVDNSILNVLVVGVGMNSSQGSCVLPGLPALLVGLMKNWHGPSTPLAEERQTK